MASAFDHPFLFLRHPNGGVEDLDRMKAAGFAGVFVNIGDHAPEAWESIVRPRALAQGMFCGPWAHTRQADGRFAPHVLEELVRVSDRWDSPLIVNSEKEIDGSGDACTGMIAEEVGDRDAAVSMEAWLFNPPSVDWTPVAHLPMLLQIFPEQPDWPSNDPAGCKQHAHECLGPGSCVYFTFGSYGAFKPSLFDLASPYSVYTGDDMGGDYQAWAPTSTGFEACIEDVPDGGGVMDVIGSQHGISALANVFREQWPDKTKKPDPDDHTTWGAIDKWERSQLILVQDHDEGL